MVLHHWLLLLLLLHLQLLLLLHLQLLLLPLALRLVQVSRRQRAHLLRRTLVLGHLYRLYL